MKIHSKTLICTLLLLLFIIVIYNMKDATLMNNYLNWLGVAIYFYAIFTWHWEKGDSFFSLYTIFYTFFVIFSYGQCIMWALGIGLDRGIGTGQIYYGSSIIPHIVDMNNIKWYSCICFIAFHFGALIFAKKSAYIGSANSSCVDNTDRNLLYKVGCIITLIIAPITLYFRFKEAIIALQYGYNALYYGDFSTQGGYTQILLYLFFPGLVCMLIGSNFSKNSKMIAFTIFGIYMLLSIASGDRGSWLYSLIILIWLKQHSTDTRVELSKYFMYFIICIAGVCVLSTITSARDSGGISSLTFTDLKNAFIGKSSPIVDAFFEMGSSMGIIAYLLTIKTPIYPYNNTYLTAILGAFSSRLLGVFGLKQVLIADWFSQDYLGLNYGVGFSMIGEAYVNGGYWGGVIYIMILGAIIGRFLAVCKNSFDIKSHPTKAFIAVSAANVLTGLPRGASYLTVKGLFYSIIPVLVLKTIYKLILRRRSNILGKGDELNNASTL